MHLPSEGGSRCKTKKTYNVTVVGLVTKDEVKKLEDGVDIGDFITNKAHVKILKTDSTTSALAPG